MSNVQYQSNTTQKHEAGWNTEHVRFPAPRFRKIKERRAWPGYRTRPAAAAALANVMVKKVYSWNAARGEIQE